MSGDIVNLNRARKAKARAEATAQAAENRVKFGRTKAEKHLADAQQSLDRTRVDGHRIETRPDPVE